VDPDRHDHVFRRLASGLGLGGEDRQDMSTFWLAVLYLSFLALMAGALLWTHRDPTN
jgi:hypothetical protein